MKIKPSSLLPNLAWIAVCAVVVGIFSYGARSGLMESLCPGPSDTYYNLLARGFRAGHLSLEKDVPPGLAGLADPYDPAANSVFRISPNGVHDLSYFRGRLYLYFGATPALILFWPFAALTGHYLYHREAAAIFCAVGFLAGAALLRSLWRRRFDDVGVGIAAFCALALGLTTGMPVLLSRSEVYEVAIGCGAMLTMFALAASWRALDRPEQRLRWLAAAGVAFGLAIGARPSLLPAAVFLLAPAWPARSPGAGGGRAGGVVPALLCAYGPVAAVGLGLLLYNGLRFGSVLEFGQHYQLANDRQDTAAHFSARYLGFNFRVNFLSPVSLTRHFPFVGRIAAPPLPAGHAPPEDPFGVLTNIPLLWLALAAPLAWRGRPREQTGALRRFAAAAALLFAGSALTLCLFYGSCSRYEVEFLPPLALLAVMGILGIERALAGRRIWRLAARCGWGLLLALSASFNLLAAVAHYAESRGDLGLALVNAGRTEDAVRVFTGAVRLVPDSAAARVNLGYALALQGRLPEAQASFREALRLDPGNFDARRDLGNALLQARMPAEAAAQYQEALHLRPGDARVRAALGSAFERSGRVREAIAQYREALRVDPRFAEAELNLGNALSGEGRYAEAEAHFRGALAIKPMYPEAYYDLANALGNEGSLPEAVVNYREALRQRPEYAEALANLGLALARSGLFDEAAERIEAALRLRPGYAEAHAYLGFTRAGEGRLTDAVSAYRDALRLDPDNAEVHYQLALVLRSLGDEAGARTEFGAAQRR